MKMLFAVAASVVLACGAAALAQEEKPVPKDSERIAIPGCARGRSFVVGERPEHEPVRSSIQPGRRFRLAGPKKVLDEIKARESSMIEVTGLVRKSQLAGPGGVAVAGGRVRIGGGVPQAPMGSGGVTRDPMYYEVVIDVESFRPLLEPCPSR